MAGGGRQGAMLSLELGRLQRGQRPPGQPVAQGHAGWSRARASGEAEAPIRRSLVDCRLGLLEPGDLIWMSHTISPLGPGTACPRDRKLHQLKSSSFALAPRAGPSTLPPAGMCLPLAASQLGSRKVGSP